MTVVKLTFEKGTKGNRIIIDKDGGFTLDEMQKITSSVESMFASEPGDSEEEEDVEDVDDEEVDRMQREEEAGNDDVKEENEEIKEEAAEQGKDIDTTRKTKDGTIDQRQLNRGQGRAGGETKAEHEKKTKNGDVDKRTTRASRTPEELKDEPFMKRLQKESKHGTDTAR